MTVNENYLVFRQFKYLRARLLLNIQDQLREYEEELDFIEGILPSANLACREYDDYSSGTRQELMGKIEERYEKYSKLRS